MKSCNNCKWLMLCDDGYSNYTVTETNASCLKGHFSDVEESYSWKRNPDHPFHKIGNSCPDFKESETQLHFDVDGETIINDYADDLELVEAYNNFCNQSNDK